MSCPSLILSLDSWQELATVCGFTLSGEDVHQLHNHHYIRALEDGSYSVLQLLGVSKYIELVRRDVHPWSADTPKASELEAYTGWYAQAHTHLASMDTTALVWWSEEIGAWLERQAVLPFPLGILTDALSEDVTSQWSGPARLVIVLSQAHATLNARIAQQAQPSLVTAPSVLVSTEVERVEISPAEPGIRQTAEIQSPLERIKHAADASSEIVLEDVHETPLVSMSVEMIQAAHESSEDDLTSDALNSLGDEPSVNERVTQEAEALDLDEILEMDSLAEELSESFSEPLVETPTSEVDDSVVEEEEEELLVAVVPKSPSIESSSDFSRQAPALTARTLDLQERLSNLRKADLKPLAQVEAPVLVQQEEPFSEVIEESVSLEALSEVSLVIEEDMLFDSEPVELEPQESLAEQIAALNAKREGYMRTQNWTGLVHLYEDGITLFPVKDRPQIYLTLSKLHELKLNNYEEAFRAAAQAYEVSDTQGRVHAREMVERLGQRAEVSAMHHTWLSGQLAGDQLDPKTRLLFMHQLAQLDQSSGNAHHGAMMFGQAMVKHPEVATQDGALDILETLGQVLDSAHLDSIYDEIIDAAPNDDVRFGTALHAGLGALEREEHASAMHHLWQALVLRPMDDAAFHSLISVCEEEAVWARLVDVYALRVRKEPGREALVARRDEFMQKMMAQPDDALRFYNESIEARPERVELIDDLVVGYERLERFGELYGVLSRHLEHAQTLRANVHVLYILADLAITRLHAPEEAEVHYTSILNHAKQDPVVLHKLFHECLDQQAWEVAVRVALRLSQIDASTLSQVQRVELGLAAARTASTLDDLISEEALLTYVLSMQPHHEGAQTRLQSLQNSGA